MTSSGDLDGHRRSITDARWSPDGERVLTASDDRTARIWSLGSATADLVLDEHERPVERALFSPDGRLVLTQQSGGKLRVFDGSSGRLRFQVGADLAIRGLFSPDGRHLILEEHGMTIRFWDTRTGRSLGDRGWQGALFQAAHGIEDPMSVFDPEHDRLLCRASGGSWLITLREIGTGADVAVLAGHRSYPLHAAFSPDRTRILSFANGANVIRLWRPSSWVARRRLPHGAFPAQEPCISPDGRFFVTTTSDFVVQIRAVLSHRVVRELRGHEGDSLRSPRYSGDGRRIVTDSADGTVRVWDADSGKELAQIEKGSTSASRPLINRDGTRVLTAEADGRCRLWDAEDGSSIATFDGPCRFSPTGRWITLVEKMGSVQIFDGRTGTRIGRCGERDRKYTGKHFLQGDALLSLGDYDRREFVFFQVGSGNRAGLLWGIDLATRRFSADGTRVLIWGRANATIHSVPDGREIVSIPRPGPHSSRFSHDGKRIALADQAGTVRLFDTSTGRETAELQAHRRPVIHMEFTPGDRSLWTLGGDARVLRWDLDSGLPDLEISAEGPFLGFVLAEDGSSITTSSRSDGDILRTWSWPTDLFGEATRLKPRELTFDERREFDLLRPEDHAAKAQVDSLFGQWLRAREVVDRLSADETLAEATRRAAIALARMRGDPSAAQLNKDAWRIISRRDRSAEDYRRATRMADLASRIAPRSHELRNTLGVAQYRCGQWREALQTLSRSDAGYRAAAGNARPHDLAFLAMVHERLGEHEQAKAKLAELREVMKEERYRDDAEAQAFLREAKTLIR